MPSDLHDVIVVLGAAQNPDGSPGPAITRRVRMPRRPGAPAGRR